nr:hypothetical protein [Tanacetum cinerariifolium]
MTTTAAQQVALDNALKEPTDQVVIDALALTTCYPAFLITADVPDIYTHQFWFTINKHDSSYRFKIVKKKFTLNMEVFKEISQYSHFYKTYLAFATGAASPKKARKFKKPASPLKKSTLVIVEEEVHEPAKKVVPSKKSSRKKSTGIQIQDTPGVKKVLRRSQQETTIHQAGGSGDGAGFQPEVPNEPKGKSVDIHKGTGLKPRVPDVSKAYSFESEYESWDDTGDEANVQGDDEDVQDSDDETQHADEERIDSEDQETKDDKEEFDDKFVHTHPNYVPTDDETNDESNDVDEEEYDRIYKELYGDANVRLTDTKQDNEGKEDADMTDVAHVQVKQTQEQTMSVREESGLEMTSVQGPHTSPLLTIPVFVIPKHTVLNPSKTVTTAPATTITLLLLSLFPNLHQSTPIPIPTNTKATTLTSSILESETLNAIHHRLLDMEKEVKELKNVHHSSELLSKIKSEIPNVIKEYLGTSLNDALYKVLNKHDADIIKEFSVHVEIVERLT